MVVPARHYNEVSRWVDATHLRTRFVFLLVVERSQGVVGGTMSGNRVAARLSFRRDHPLHAWVAAEVNNKFRHVCVDHSADLKQESYALTKNGLIKAGASQHVKDDRTQIDDMSNWVLGWSAEAKISRLESLLGNLAAEKAKLDARDVTLRRLIDQLRGSLTAVAQLLGIDSFSRLDYLAEEKTIAELLDRKKELEDLSEPIKQLIKQLEDVENKITELRARAKQMDQEKGALDKLLSDCRDKLSVLGLYLATRPDFIPEVYRQRIEAIQEPTDITLRNLESVQGTVLSKVQEEAKQQGVIGQKARERMLPQMQSFLRAYPIIVFPSFDRYLAAMISCSNDYSPRHRVFFHHFLVKTFRLVTLSRVLNAGIMA
jgi:hypothetical protein